MAAWEPAGRQAHAKFSVQRLLRLAMLPMADFGSQAPHTNGLQLELLGTPRLMRGAVAVQVLEPKDAALLAMLVVEGPMPRSRVATLIWPDSDAARAGGNLRQRLFRMKRLAGQDVVVGDRQIRLADEIEHDLRAFTDRVLLDGAGGFSELLGSADYGMGGELGDWVRVARQRWRAARRQALAEAASQLEGQGALAQALVLSERLVIDDPAAEHAHRRVMRLHYLRGDRAAALAAFERCISLLDRELGTAPGKETQQLAATIQASAVLQRPASHPLPQPLPASLRRPPELVGREAQWRQLEMEAGRAGVVVIEGEPGSGKSRLLNDFALAHGWPVPVAGRPGDEGVAYALVSRWIDALATAYPECLGDGLRSELAHLVPRLADPQRPPAGLVEPTRLKLAIETALTRWRQAVRAALAGRCADVAASAGLTFDDLQFADQASVELLLALATAGRGDGNGWTWLLALRAGTRPGAIQGWQERFEPAGLTHLHLQALDEASVATLLQSLRLPGMRPSDWALPLLQYCGGFPFAVIDTLADLHAQGRHEFSGPPELPAASPQRLSAIVRRLDQLSPPARQLAHVAATAGQDFCVELSASVLECAPVALAAPWHLLEQAGLFRGGGFAHDLVRQAALEALPAAIEAVMHRQIARWLVRSDDAMRAPRSARIAAHWEGANEWVPAAQAYERAAQEARARSAPREELSALHAAARCHRQAGHSSADDAAFDCEWRGVALLLVLDSTDAALARAEALMDRAANDRQRAAALVARAQVRVERYESEMALEDASAAGGLAAKAGSLRLQGLAAQRAAVALTRLSRPEEGLALLQTLGAAFEQFDDEERLLWLSDHAAALESADRRVDALAAFDKVIAQAEALGRWSAASEAWGNKGIALMHLGHSQANCKALQQAVECGRRSGAERGNMLIDEMSLAGALRDLGRFSEYLAVAEPLPPALREVGYPFWAFNAENDLAICFAWLGRPELAQQTLTPMPEDLVPMMRAARWFTQARLMRWQAPGKGFRPHRQAGELVRKAQALIDASGSGGRSHVRLRVELELAFDEEPAQALQRVVRIEAEARQRELGMLAAHARLLHIELLLAQGHVPAAAALALELLANCSAEGPPPAAYVPEVYWVIHRALLEPEPLRAGAALGLALDWIETVAAKHVPAAFERSFRARNPVNVAVLTAAAAAAHRTGGGAKRQRVEPP